MCLTSFIQAAENQKQTYTRDFAKLLQLNICAKVILTINVDIDNHVINSQRRKFLMLTLLNISLERYMFYDAGLCLKTMTASHSSIQHSWVGIKKRKP